jgi:hypothetical protein
LNINRRFKSAGTAAADSAVFFGSNVGAQAINFGISLNGGAGGFNTGLFINRGGNGGRYGIDISTNTWGLAGLNLGPSNAIQWGSNQLFGDTFQSIGLKNSDSPGMLNVYMPYPSVSGATKCGSRESRFMIRTNHELNPLPQDR